jgi:nucleoside-diphosphate-sugar epimerase
MTSLVTGATGFIGRKLVTFLACRGEAVRAQYRDDAKRRLYLSGVGSDAEVIRGDVCDPQFMRDAVADASVIYHCAAAHSTCPEAEIMRTNLDSVRCLFTSIRDAGTTPRVILMSSINVLGNGSFADGTEKLPRKRTHDLHVDLKIAAEELAEQWIAQGVDVVILRPGLVYGPGDPHLLQLAKAIYLGRFVFIGSRNNVVPLVHVSDMAESICAAASAPVNRGRIYHIADGSRTTIGELVRQLCRVLDCPEPKRVLPAAVPRLANSVCGLLGRNGPVSQSALRFLGSSRYVNIELARTELSFDPRIPVELGVESMRTALHEAAVTDAAA